MSDNTCYGCGKQIGDDEKCYLLYPIWQGLCIPCSKKKQYRPIMLRTDKHQTKLIE